MITDHEHQPERLGAFVGPRCSVCWERNAAHLSWGEFIAARVGGNPLDYIDKGA